MRMRAMERGKEKVGQMERVRERWRERERETESIFFFFVQGVAKKHLNRGRFCEIFCFFKSLFFSPKNRPCTTLLRCLPFHRIVTHLTPFFVRVMFARGLVVCV